MKINNSNFGWPDSDLNSVEPVHTFPGEASDEEMRRDTLPNFSGEIKWILALRDLRRFTEGIETA